MNKRIRELVESPRESLSVELKGWLDPREPEDAAKIVKAVIAMRNNDGGTLLIGFDNKTRTPLATTAPSDIEERFHVDVVQGLVTKHSSDPFEVGIYFEDIEGQKYPVIDVPSGVKSPAVMKKPIMKDEVAILRENTVFVRSLLSNNTPSTTEARVEDWPRLVEVCFENREADVARFIRRHLSTVTPETVTALTELIKKTEAPSIDSKLQDFMDQCLTSFKRAKNKRGVDLPSHGSWEVGLIIDGEGERFQVNEDFRRRITANAPDHTGWPLWLDTSGFGDEESRPYVKDHGWEAYTINLSSNWADHIDFMRWEPDGRFYQWRALEDDVSPSHPEPLTQLDFSLAILRTAEAVLVGRSFAVAMSYDDDTTLHFAFRWIGLEGRRLTSWVHPGRSLSRARKSEEGTVYTTVAVPLGTSRTAIAPYVREVVNELFSRFGGFSISLEVVEDLVKRLIERRL